jgi:hypothetical protein
MTRLIDADELKPNIDKFIGYLDEDMIERIKVVIDNAPTVTSERPQGKWFDYIEAGTLKARHGDYVLYKVDFLLDNLTREVYIMEGARRMRGKEE